jgi:hypothetical protein
MRQKMTLGQKVVSNGYDQIKQNGFPNFAGGDSRSPVVVRDR